MGEPRRLAYLHLEVAYEIVDDGKRFSIWTYFSSPFYLIQYRVVCSTNTDSSEYELYIEIDTGFYVPNSYGSLKGSAVIGSPNYEGDIYDGGFSFYKYLGITKIKGQNIGVDNCKNDYTAKIGLWDKFFLYDDSIFNKKLIFEVSNEELPLIYRNY